MNREFGSAAKVKDDEVKSAGLKNSGQYPYNERESLTGSQACLPGVAVLRP